MTSTKKYFPLLPHGSLKEILPNIYTVTGTMRLFGLFQYSRAMTIIKNGNDLSLLNPVRVGEGLLNQINKLGNIKYLLKIGQLHNVDVPFYMDRYSPELWINKTDPSIGDYEPSGYFVDNGDIPFLNAKVKVIEGSKIKESVLISLDDGGCLHSCDAFVNMGVDPNHNWLTGKLSKFLPDPTYIGPNWIKVAKPPQTSMKAIFEYDFENFIPAHGEPILGKAKQKLSHYIENYSFKH